MIASLKGRKLIDFSLPETPNFKEDLRSFTIDPSDFVSGKQAERYPDDRFFQGNLEILA